MGPLQAILSFSESQFFFISKNAKGLVGDPKLLSLISSKSNKNLHGEKSNSLTSLSLANQSNTAVFTQCGQPHAWLALTEGSELSPSITARTSQGQVLPDYLNACEWLWEIMKLCVQEVSGRFSSQQCFLPLSMAAELQKASGVLPPPTLNSALQAAPFLSMLEVSLLYHFLIHNASVCPGYTQPSSNFKHQSVCTM